ncbi:MAG: pseudouridine synthase [bacterium]|nr:pseudouridine synthase [bacterium]MDZ4285694.1 pseudouridine synthase [Candidatus Sungbacteria bacterium]
MEPIKFPIRINRYLALKGIVTRRSADDLIKKRRVTINGRIAVLGDAVEKNDDVLVNTPHKHVGAHTYIAYNKPKEVITHSPQEGEKSIADFISDKRLFPVGRLDKDSTGLIILTNDGRVTDRLLNPKYDHEKEYVVDVDKKLTPHVLRILQQGVMIEGYKTKPSKTLFINDKKFRIILGEGKKHQIRRMVAAMGFQVRSLKRVRIMNIELGKLKEGEMREITGDELSQFLKTLGLMA